MMNLVLPSCIMCLTQQCCNDAVGIWSYLEISGKLKLILHVYCAALPVHPTGNPV